MDKDKPVPYDAVKIDYPVDLRLVAECVDVSATDLQDLNPSLLRLTTPKDRQFELHLPAGTKEKFETAIAAIPPDMRVWWRYHKVQSGDTLASLARTYRTTPKAIAEANNLEDGQELAPDSKLTIPIAPGKHASTEETAAYAHRLTRYKVRKGDTVQSVADNFGVPPAMVRKWNHLKGNSLTGRSIVYVHLPITPNASKEEFASAAPRSASPSKSKTKKTVAASSTAPKPVLRHTVKQGETLYSIASSYRTTVDAIKRDNSNVAVLRPGMVLVIKGSALTGRCQPEHPVFGFRASETPLYISAKRFNPYPSRQISSMRSAGAAIAITSPGTHSEHRHRRPHTAERPNKHPMPNTEPA